MLGDRIDRLVELTVGAGWGWRHHAPTVTRRQPRRLGGARQGGLSQFARVGVTGLTASDRAQSEAGSRIVGSVSEPTIIKGK